MFWKYVIAVAAAAAAVVDSQVTLPSQKFTLEPQNQTVVWGSEVLFVCAVANRTGILHWIKDDVEINLFDVLGELNNRYSISIKEKELSVYSLKISSIKFTDEGEFQCRVSEGPSNQPEIRSRYAKLTVLALPDSPEILQGESLVTTEFEETQLDCVSRAGKPAAKVTWMDSHGNVLKENIEEFVEPVSDGQRFTVRSVLKLIPQKHHNNATFTCLTENEADRLINRSVNTRSAKLKLHVNYAPRVYLNITSGIIESEGWSLEGMDITLLCKADGNPIDMTYKWFINNNLVESDSETKLIIKNVSRKFHGARVNCTVQNQVGTTSSFEILNVAYGPKFVSGHKNIEAELGVKEILICDVEGNPPPNVVWFHKKTEKIVGTTANLTVIVDNNSVGSYHCRASSPNFPAIEMNLATIIIKNHFPVITYHTELEFVNEGVQLECIVHSSSSISNISWIFRGELIDSSNKDYSILENPLTQGIKSTLLIHKPEPKHYGIYNCSATNSYGTNSVNIILKTPVSGKFLSSLTFKGGMAAVVLLIVVLIIVLVVNFHIGFLKKSLNQVERDKDKKSEKEPSSELKFEKLKSEDSEPFSELPCLCNLDIKSESNAIRIGPPQLMTYNSLPRYKKVGFSEENIGPLPSSGILKTSSNNISTQKSNTYNTESTEGLTFLTKFASLPRKTNVTDLNKIRRMHSFYEKFPKPEVPRKENDYQKYMYTFYEDHMNDHCPGFVENDRESIKSKCLHDFILPSAFSGIKCSAANDSMHFKSGEPYPSQQFEQNNVISQPKPFADETEKSSFLSTEV